MNNTFINPVLGTFDAHVEVPYSADDLNTVMAYLRTGYYHVHASQFSIPRTVTPITITAGVGADTEGAKVEMLAAGTYSFPLDLHWLVTSNISEDDNYMVTIYTGDVGEEVFWCEKSFSRDTVSTPAADSQDHRIQGPQIPAGVRISASLKSGSGENTVAIKLEAHGYPTAL